MPTVQPNVTSTSRALRQPAAAPAAPQSPSPAGSPVRMQRPAVIAADSVPQARNNSTPAAVEAAASPQTLSTRLRKPLTSVSNGFAHVAASGVHLGAAIAKRIRYRGLLPIVLTSLALSPVMLPAALVHLGLEKVFNLDHVRSAHGLPERPYKSKG